MSTYIPKPGDRVTSPLLVGEWEVRDRASWGSTWWWLAQDNELIPEIAGRLTRVPTVPPEPPIGSVVITGERVFQRIGDRWFSAGVSVGLKWSSIPGDVTPAVPLADVVQALVEFGNEPMPSRTGDHNFMAREYDTPAERIERLFGWPS